MSSTTKKVLSIETINPKLRTMQYAVRGLVPTKAGEISRQIKTSKQKGANSEYPFEDILYCNIGNPQSVGQKPVTFYRDVLALVDAPHLLSNTNVSKLFPGDCISRATEILSYLPSGTGAYSDSQGVEEFRKSVAKFIERRDGYPSNSDHIFLSNGASTAINFILNTIISDEKTGVLIPIPQYPIYSALITLLNGTQLNYHLDEEKNWAVDMPRLKESLKKAREKGVNPKAMVIINPGNPTGNVFSYEQLKELVKLCKTEKLVLLADEVYQENVYYPEQKFHSVKKVVRDLGSEYDSFEFISFHSTSKGILGECGRRGGYMEICGFDNEVLQQVVKLASANLCSNLDGQLMTHLMVSPPTEGDESYPLFKKETNSIFSSLQRKAKMLHARLNSIDGVSCQRLEGAMYAFPRIHLEDMGLNIEKLKKEAGSLPLDAFYSLSLLNSTGICCVPGSGFGQEEGTHHIRLTFLPEEEKLDAAMDSFKEHHEMFRKKYS